MTWLKIGQTFALNNCDYYVLADEWIIVDIDYPIVTFSNNKNWLVDIAGVLPYSTETILGTVNSETDEVAIIALQRTPLNCEDGILIKQGQASYLQSIDPIIHS
jgi:hypothetical protein